MYKIKSNSRNLIGFERAKCDGNIRCIFITYSDEAEKSTNEDEDRKDYENDNETVKWIVVECILCNHNIYDLSLVYRVLHIKHIDILVWWLNRKHENAVFGKTMIELSHNWWEVLWSIINAKL